MDEQKQDDQLEPTYNSSVLIQDIALKTYRKRRTIVLMWHDDGDDDFTLVRGSYTSTGEAIGLFETPANRVRR